MARVRRVVHAVEIRLAWNANQETDLAGYNLYWSESVVGPFSLRSVFDKYATSCTVQAKPNQYWFYLTAFDNVYPSLESGPSNVVTNGP